MSGQVSFIDCGEGCDDDVIGIAVPGLPGPPGVLWVNLGSRPSPIEISTVITLNSQPSLRVFIKGHLGPVIDPAMAHISGNLQVILFGTDNTNTVKIEKSSGNFELSGTWVARNGSILVLQWDGTSKYTEAYRNEI